MNMFIDDAAAKSLRVLQRLWRGPTGRTCGSRCIDEEWVDVLHSISVIDLRERGGQLDRGWTCRTIVNECCVPIDKHLQDKGVFLAVGEVQFWHFVWAFWVGAKESGSLSRFRNGRAYVVLCQVLKKKNKKIKKIKMIKSQLFVKETQHQQLTSASHNRPDCTASRETMLMTHSLKSPIRRTITYTWLVLKIEYGSGRVRSGENTTYSTYVYKWECDWGDGKIQVR